MTDNIKYENAVKRLEEIVSSMENGELDIDTLGERLKEAKRLLRMCREKLTNTEKEVKLILDDDSQRQ